MAESFGAAWASEFLESKPLAVGEVVVTGGLGIYNWYLWVLKPDTTPTQVFLWMAAMLICVVCVVGLHARRAWQKERTAARAAVGKLTAFDPKFQFARVSVLDFEENETGKADRFYAAVEQVAITNGSDVACPVEVWLRIGINSAMAVAFVAKHKTPDAHVLRDFGFDSGDQLRRIVNLQARTASTVGFLVFRLDSSVLAMLNAPGDVKAVLKQPLWVDLRNTVTGRDVAVPLNSQAHTFDMKRRAAKAKSTTP
ncbi:MAG: hypothetical protein AB7P99_10665 [Vicinamibacterales bacterium]